MTGRCLLIVAWTTLFAGGCTSTVSPGHRLEGERFARVTDVAGAADDDARPAVVPVEHVFELSNPGSEPLVIVSSRTRIDTVWHFADTGDALLPRSVAAGESLRVAVTAKVRRPGPQRFFVELQLDSGEAVRLDLLVNG